MLLLLLLLLPMLLLLLLLRLFDSAASAGAAYFPTPKGSTAVDIAVYAASAEGMTPEKRLRRHLAHSSPLRALALQPLLTLE